MARGQGTLTLRRRTSRIENIAEIRKRAGMYAGILVRILIRVRMDHAAKRLRFLNHPSAIAFFKIVANLHSSALRGTVLWAELDFGMSLIAVDGDAANVHVHGVHVERADAREMLHDARADGVIFALLFFAAAGGEEQGENSDG